MPAAAPAPRTMNERRVRRTISCSGVRILRSVAMCAIGFHKIAAANHATEIGPSGANNLRYVDYEESKVSHGEPEMLPPRPLVAAEHGGQPVELRGFVNSETCKQTQAAHQNDS